MTKKLSNPPDPEHPEMEYSAHNGPHTHGGITVHVSICRLAGTDDHWILEVENTAGGSTVWDDPFETDDSAYAEFLATIAKEGIEQFEFEEQSIH